MAKANALLRVQPILTQLAACLCAGLDSIAEAAPLTVPKPCFCGVVPGNAVINDVFVGCNDRDGYASVRLASSYPAEVPGEVSTRRQNLKLGLGFDIEISVQRTLLGDEDDHTVTEAQAAAMVTQEVLDMKAVFQAVGCCEALSDVEVVVGTWTPMGPQGLVYGGSLIIYGLLP